MTSASSIAQANAVGIPARLQQFEQAPRERRVVVEVRRRSATGRPCAPRAGARRASSARAGNASRAMRRVGIFVSAPARGSRARARRSRGRSSSSGSSRRDPARRARCAPASSLARASSSRVLRRRPRRATKSARDVADRRDDVQVPLAFEVGFAVEPETPREHLVLLGLEQCRAPRRASRRRTCLRDLRNPRRASNRSRPRAIAQVAQHPVRGFLGDAAEQRLAGRDGGLRVRRRAAGRCRTASSRSAGSSSTASTE